MSGKGVPRSSDLTTLVQAHQRNADDGVAYFRPAVVSVS